MRVWDIKDRYIKRYIFIYFTWKTSGVSYHYVDEEADHHDEEILGFKCSKSSF